MTMKKSVVTLFAVAVFGVAATAEARHVRFLGPHPVSAKHGGGYCYIEVPHLHLYPPDHPALYQQVGEDYVFTGDPTPFGYDGDRYKFYGHHPVAGAGGDVYCLIDGPHFHPYAAPSAPEYKMESDVAFYVAPLPDAYARQRTQRERLVNLEYQPYGAMRPQVEVTPPPEWRGTAYVAMPAPPVVEVQAPEPVGVAVAPPQPPGVYVQPPRPPGVIVEPPRPPSVVMAAPQPPGVYVAPPRPPGVVVVAPPPGVIVAPPRPPGIVVAPPHPGGVFFAPPRPPGIVVAPPHPGGVFVAPPRPGGVVVGVPVPGVIVEGGGHGHHDNGVRRHGGRR